MLRECVVLVLVCVFGAGSLSGRGLFCRDPETGQLHPENSTWTSSSFCGTYHCKVRRKNLTNTQYAPMRQINITTNVQPLAENDTIKVIPKEENLVKKEEVVKNVNTTDNKTIYNLIPHLVHSNNTLKDIQGIKVNDDIDDQNASEQDRYLSEKEIKSLTEILHTVKKGDLDAIVEIYNLAQDIYKELDQTSTDLVLQEAVTAKTSERQIVSSELFKKLTQRDHASYFYDPLSNTKIRVAELLRPDVVNNELNPELPVMVIRNSKTWLDERLPGVAGANFVNGTMKVTKKTIPVGILSSFPIEKATKSKKQKLSDDFFNSPLTHNDFGKLPYYYPMSNFQRMSSYKHDQKKTLVGNSKAEVLALLPVPATTLAPIPLRIQPESKPIQTHAHVPAWIPESKPLRISETIPQQTYARIPAQILESKSDPKQPQRYAQIPARILEQKSDPKLPQTNVHLRIPDPFQAHAPFPARVLDPISARKSEPRPASMQERVLVRLPSLIPEHLPSRIPSRTQAPPLRRIPIRFPEPVPPRPLVLPKATTSRPAPVLTPKSPHKPVKSKPVTTGTKYVKELRPSIFLPYPFSNMQQSNNWSFIQSLYNGERVAKLEAAGRINATPLKKIKFPNDDDNRNNLIVMKEPEKQKQSNVVLMNPDLENFQDLQIRASMNKETVAAANGKQSKNEDHRVPARRRPAWQTDSLPEHIIEEVRAHIQEKHRTFIHTLPFRKKVKLERVGTLFNMDQLTRTKREVEEKKNAIEAASLELYEVFIEKTTCDADYSVPGFFRYGNLSEPYPECCPQRIPPT